jgi:hypothetical protein
MATSCSCPKLTVSRSSAGFLTGWMMIFGYALFLPPVSR